MLYAVLAYERLPRNALLSDSGKTWTRHWRCHLPFPSSTPPLSQVILTITRKLFLVYLKFTFNWISCILSDPLSTYIRRGHRPVKPRSLGSKGPRQRSTTTARLPGVGRALRAPASPLSPKTWVSISSTLKNHGTHKWQGPGGPLRSSSLSGCGRH